MAQIPLPDSLLARLRQTAQQDGLSLPLLFEQMLDTYLRSRQQSKPENGAEQGDDPQASETFDPMDREVAAFRQLHVSLLKHYRGEYVAIHQGQLVDHDSDKVALLERIEKTYPDEFVLIRPVQEQPEREFYFRSPRYIERV